MGKTFATLICLMAFGYTAAVNAQPAPVPVQSLDLSIIKAEREALMTVYLGCLQRAANKLDDRKSDPATIARGMLSACATQFDIVVEAHSRYLEDYVRGREKVAAALRQASTDTAIQMVLKHRAPKK